MCALRLRYETIEFGEIDIHVRGLRDRMEYEDIDGEAEAHGIRSSNWALFGVLWESSRVLAEFASGCEIEGRRILEVGCGLGLSSLVLNRRGADISATDYHPSAGEFLRANAALNGDAEIPFVRVDWQDKESGLGLFDLIVASDLLYERGHAEMLCAFIDRHALPACEVVVVDPGRGQLNRFGRLMADLGYDCTVEPQPDIFAADEVNPRSRTHRFLRA